MMPQKEEIEEAPTGLCISQYFILFCNNFYCSGTYGVYG